MADMREIEAFLAVAEEMHFGRAAGRLGLSASRVSFLVKRLERRVEAPLFERTSRRVTLTPQGEHLAAEIRPAKVTIDRALADVSAWPGERGEILRVGFANTLPEVISAELAAAFERRHPGCQVVQSAHPATDMLHWPNRDWVVDILVTWMPGEPALLGVPGLEAGPVIWRESRAAVLAADHPLAGRAEIDVEELAGHDVLYSTSVPQGFAIGWTPPVTPAGRPMSLRRVGATYVEETVRMVVEDGTVHLSFVSFPSRFRGYDLSVVPVAGLPPMTVAPLWPATSARHRLAPAFAQSALAHATEAGWPLHSAPSRRS